MNKILLTEYYEEWINIYKRGAVRNVTLKKYLITLQWLKKIANSIYLNDITRSTYQQMINDYALEHEKQTTMDFHHHLKSAILDAVDEGYLSKDPTRKAIIKGKEPRLKKIKFLNQFELQLLTKSLNLTNSINWDWLIYIIIKTGIRFSEALAITPDDFDFNRQTLTINKTWDYKENTGFAPTKNLSSNRKIQLDWQTIMRFSQLIANLNKSKPIFFKEKVYNSTINKILERHCLKKNISVITVHGLRHTHASLLLFAGASIASVSRRLGHSSMTTTQKIYLHIIQELENQDNDIIMRQISQL